MTDVETLRAWKRQWEFRQAIFQDPDLPLKTRQQETARCATGIMACNSKMQSVGRPAVWKVGGYSVLLKQYRDAEARHPAAKSRVILQGLIDAGHYRCGFKSLRSRYYAALRWEREADSVRPRMLISDRWFVKMAKPPT